jgi:hypothetical protein
MALRSPKNLLKLSRSPKTGRLQVVNHFARTVDAVAPTTNFPRLKAFLSSNLWPWVWNYLKYAFTPRCDFRTYSTPGDNGVYQIAPLGNSNSISIAIAGDWGTGTQEAYDIANLITETKPDFTIHLGDVYYVGDEPEIEEKCFGKSTDGYDGVTWPKGRRGSFALNGNHEMYANGGPYFNVLLRRLGIEGSTNGQAASFFSLETDQWRVVGIDTGYNSVGIPILSAIPLINKIPFIGGDCHLEKELIDWLRDEVKVDTIPKATVLLSHHQYFSAFPNEQEYKRPGSQLQKFFDGQEFIWIWGHEHRLAIYEKYEEDGLAFFGRCVGHSGMPVELEIPKASKRAPLRLYDTRGHKLDEENTVGQNGFVNLIIQGGNLTLDYRDVDNIQVLVEHFTANPDRTLTYAAQDPGILKAPPG